MQEKVEAEHILSMNSVEVLYDNVMLAIKGVSVKVPKGEMIALLGSNGAGKSTTLKAISGLLKAERGRISRGEITFQGTEITEVLAQNRVGMGICHVIEGRRVFEHLTPDENLTAAAPRGMSRSTLNAEKEKIYDYFPRLAERRNSQAGYLSGGEQQMLAIARALARDIKVLLLDEPYEGLAPVIVDEIERTLRKIKEQGITTVIVEQNAVRALELADRAVILDTGTVVFDGSAAEVLENKELREEYLAI